MFYIKKAQIWLLDFIIAITLFTAVLLYYFNYTSQSQVDESVIVDDLLREASDVSSVLVQQGIPFDWNESTVKLIGLGDNKQHLIPEKVIEMSKIDYSQTKRLIGTTHDYSIYFADKNDNLLNLFGNCSLGSSDVGINSSYKLAGYFQGGDSEFDDEINEIETELGIDIYEWQNYNELKTNMSVYDIAILENPHFNQIRSDEISDFISKDNVTVLGIGEIGGGAGPDKLNFAGNKWMLNNNCDNITIVNDFPLFNLTTGQWFEPNKCHFVNGDLDVIGVSRDLNPEISGNTTIATWEYGNGTVYFIADLESNDGLNEDIFQDWIKEGVKDQIVDCGKALNVTVNDPTARHVVGVERFFLYESDIVKMVLYLWE